MTVLTVDQNGHEELPPDQLDRQVKAESTPQPSARGRRARGDTDNTLVSRSQTHEHPKMTTQIPERR